MTEPTIHVTEPGLDQLIRRFWLAFGLDGDPPEMVDRHALRVAIVRSVEIRPSSDSAGFAAPHEIPAPGSLPKLPQSCFNLERGPQPILPSPMMGETGHGRPSLLRWMRKRNSERKARNMLAEVYTPEGVEAWLNGRKRSLDGQRPIDLIRAGESDRVLARIAQLRDGVMG